MPKRGRILYNVMDQPQAPSSNVLPIVILIIVIVFIAGLGYWMVSDQNKKAVPPVVPTPMSDNTSDAGMEVDGTEPDSTATNPDVNSIAIEASEYSFTPSDESVAVGDKVQVNFTNNGTTDHSFNIDELNVHSNILAPGESEVVEFTIPAGAPAQYTFYCSVSSHRSMGMEGHFEVVQ